MSGEAEERSAPSRRRAIYVDFEGTATDPPSLLGALWAGDDGRIRFVQCVLEPALWPAADATRGVCGGALSAAEWADLAELRSIAEAEDRRIFAWSGHERDELAAAPATRTTARGSPATCSTRSPRRSGGGGGPSPRPCSRAIRGTACAARIGSTGTSS